jgi:FKBP-type peptidyl-prolyl cis-trans isomerase (trigger factor)
MMENFKHKISHDFNIKFEEYLATIKQDEKSVKDSFLKEAQKKAMEFLVLRELGKAEKISVSVGEIDEETNKMIKNYPADVLKKVDINGLKEYIKGVIFNEKIFQVLDKFFQKS